MVDRLLERLAMTRARPLRGREIQKDGDSLEASLSRNTHRCLTDDRLTPVDDCVCDRIIRAAIIKQKFQEPEFRGPETEGRFRSQRPPRGGKRRSLPQKKARVGANNPLETGNWFAP